MSALLAPLATGYGWAAGLRDYAYRSGWLNQRRLNRPVISVGNLSAGGTGKTPIVAYLARLLLRRGFIPSILTRGYGRSGGNSLIALDPAESRAPDPREAGDEPALLAAALPRVPIVVCADRYKAGRFAEKRFGANVHLLDDGFQHLRLARGLDIVALDVTQGLADRLVLPAGRLRERPSALRRAEIVILTRSDLADPAHTLAQLDQVQTNARIFRGGTRLAGFTEVATGRTL
ncbi:MAG: tetraacyldisaccharide 4'-kinase, partial [Terriglobia bacterium]